MPEQCDRAPVNHRGTVRVREQTGELVSLGLGFTGATQCHRQHVLEGALPRLGSLCGLIHSPLASGGLFWPGGSGSVWPGLLAGGYGLLAGLLALLAPWGEAGGSATSADRDSHRSQETHA